MIPFVVALQMKPAADALVTMGRLVVLLTAVSFSLFLLWLAVLGLGWVFARARRRRTARQLRIVTREYANERDRRAREVWKTGTADVPKFHPPRSRSEWEGGPPRDGGLPHAS